MAKLLNPGEEPHRERGGSTVAGGQRSEVAVLGRFCSFLHSLRRAICFSSWFASKAADVSKRLVLLQNVRKVLRVL